jgi:TRAP-type mannitol/chloroaromatic compound transport system permease small subunit
MNNRIRGAIWPVILLVIFSFTLSVSGIASALWEIAAITCDSAKSNEQRMKEAVERAWK